jgi:hypothetical protein
MKLLGLVLALALTGCNQVDTTKQQIRDNTTNNVSNVSDKTNNGKAIGQEYGGKGAGYGQVKKIEPGQAVPPLIEAPVHEAPIIEAPAIDTNIQILNDYLIKHHNGEKVLKVTNVSLYSDMHDLEIDFDKKPTWDREFYYLVMKLYGGENSTMAYMHNVDIDTYSIEYIPRQ